jgi:glycosyltransferase involved in cell wall biosynthesis
VSVATGEFVAFIDQDDLWHREKLERQLACFAVNPTWISALRTSSCFGSPHCRQSETPTGITVGAGACPATRRPRSSPRRSAFERVGPLNTDLLFGDGTEWTLRAADGGLAMRLLPDTLLYHRMHASNLTRQREASKAEFVRIVRSTLERRRERARGRRGHS